MLAVLKSMISNIKLFHNYHRSKVKYYSVGLIFLIAIGGCLPARKPKPPTQEQLRKEWEREHLLNILSMERVKRKDIAFLLCYYFDDILPFFEEKPLFYKSLNDSTDDYKHLDEGTYISLALRVGWMGNFPDGMFYPDDELKRFQFAIILYRVSRTLPLFQGVKLKYNEIKDVSYSDYTYKAINFAVSNKFFDLKDGFFFKDKNVTGYESARIFSLFRKRLKR